MPNEVKEFVELLESRKTVIVDIAGNYFWVFLGGDPSKELNWAKTDIDEYAFHENIQLWSTVDIIVHFKKKSFVIEMLNCKDADSLMRAADEAIAEE